MTQKWRIYWFFNCKKL